MNAFAENPLFFFVDNVPPFFSVNSSKDGRKIVELSDAGCDAKLPVSNLLQNAARYYSSKSSKMKSNEGWRPRFEEKFGNRTYRERFREQNQQNAIDAEELYFMPKEEETSQYYWQAYSPYENPNGQREFRRKPERSSRLIPERTRIRRSNQSNNLYEISSNPVRYDHNVPQNVSNVVRDDYLVQPLSRGSKITGPGLQYSRSNYSKFEQRIYDQQLVYEKQRLRSAGQDYLEDFEETPRQSRSYKDHCQRANMPTYDTEDPIEETSQQSRRFSRCNSRNVKTVNSMKSNDGKYWKEAAGSRIRSRTCSPCTDRRKRTRSISKAFCENTDHIDHIDHVDRTDHHYGTQTFQNSQNRSSNVRSVHVESLSSTCSTGRFQCFVSRAVDKDSLSDFLDASTSTERLSNAATITEPPTVDEEKQVRSSFWEFIPLDDDDEQEVSKDSENQEQKIPAESDGYPLTKRSMKNETPVSLKTKERTFQKGIVQQESARTTSNRLNSKGFNDSSPVLGSVNATGAPNNKKNILPDSLKAEHPNKPLVDSKETKLNANVETERATATKIHKNPEIVENPTSSDKNKGDPKNQSKIETKLSSGYTNGSNRYLKRPSSPQKSGSNIDKKKKVANNGVSNISDDKKTGMSFVEKTAACLKRKFEKSKVEEACNSSNQSSTTMEKKIRSEGSTYSRLPIRIGSRLRSKNPIALRLRSKADMPCKEGNKSESVEEESSGQLNSARSRTKPKIKPSVMQNKVVVEPVDAVENSKLTGNVQKFGGIKNFSRENRKIQEKSNENCVDKLVDCASETTESLELKVSKYQQLSATIEEGTMNDLKSLNMEEEQRESEMNRVYGREMDHKGVLANELDISISRNDFKEKCFFHIHDQENIVCNSYCNKDKKLSSFQSRKPVAIRSRM